MKEKETSNIEELEDQFYNNNYKEISRDYQKIIDLENEHLSVIRDIDKILKTAKDRDSAIEIIEKGFKPEAQRTLDEYNAAWNEFGQKYKPSIRQKAAIEEGERSQKGQTEEQVEAGLKSKQDELDRMYEIHELLGIEGQAVE
jgi:hypothetical protein